MTRTALHRAASSNVQAVTCLGEWIPLIHVNVSVRQNQKLAIQIAGNFN
jgi:hypothetical protein